MSTETPEAIAQLKIPELKAKCKEQGLPVSGTKAELVARLLGTAPPPKKPRTTKPAAPKLEKPFFPSLMTVHREPIVIKRNLHGHFEHPETRLVFSLQKKVIGVQTDASPDPQPLTTTDLEHVHQYHFELEEGVCVQDQPSHTLEDDSARAARLQELLQNE